MNSSFMLMKGSEAMDFTDLEKADLLLYVINRAHKQVYTKKKSGGKIYDSRIRDIPNNISYCKSSKRSMRKKYNGFKLEVGGISNERKYDNC